MSGAKGKQFEEFTVKELKDIVEGEREMIGIDLSNLPDDIARLVDGPRPDDLPDEEFQCLEDEEAPGKQQRAGEILTLSWRSDPENYKDKRYVKVKSVVDSGASAPVALPQMMPSVKIRPSEGSRRGQRCSSASKHKLKSLRQQQIKECTEAG